MLLAVEVATQEEEDRAAVREGEAEKRELMEAKLADLTSELRELKGTIGDKKGNLADKVGSLEAVFLARIGQLDEFRGGRTGALR